MKAHLLCVYTPMYRGPRVQGSPGHRGQGVQRRVLFAAGSGCERSGQRGGQEIRGQVRHRLTIYFTPVLSDVFLG